jgi:hypothetical protein
MRLSKYKGRKPRERKLLLSPPFFMPPHTVETDHPKLASHNRRRKTRGLRFVESVLWASVMEFCLDFCEDRLVVLRMATRSHFQESFKLRNSWKWLRAARTQHNLMMISLFDLFWATEPIWRMVSHSRGDATPGKENAGTRSSWQLLLLGLLLLRWIFFEPQLPYGERSPKRGMTAMPGKRTPSKQQRCIISLLHLYRTPDSCDERSPLRDDTMPEKGIPNHCSCGCRFHCQYIINIAFPRPQSTTEKSLERSICSMRSCRRSK